MSKLLLPAAVAALLGGGGYLYLRHATLYPSTDDAYITANVVHVAPQVSGPVTSVAVANQQYVHKGELLFTIDRRPFELAVEQARAQLALMEQEVAQDAAAVHSAEAEEHRQAVLLENARTTAERAHKLQGKRFLSQQDIDNAEAGFKAAKARLAVAQAQLREAQQKLGQPGEKNERIRQARAHLERAQWDLAQTEVHAACDGRTSELTMQAGDAARSGTPAFVVVCDHAYWVMANYKETQLERIRPGQSVDITVDMYPDHHFKGEVQSISGASGVAFSMLPPENATGNWVKVTQRVPVKIRVTDPDPAFPLRVGTSSVATVDTTAKRRLADAR